MGNIKIGPTCMELTPSTQRSISFGTNSGLHGISEMINDWLKENPKARITQMIYDKNCVLCLYEVSEVALVNE